MDRGKNGIVTYVGVAHPWMCDTMGHMNVRHYMAMFDDASFQLLGRLAGAGEGASHGWADVRHEIEYKREIPAGALVTIRSGIVNVGRTSLAYRHTMSGSLDDEIHAQATVTSVRFDLGARKPMELEPDVKQRAQTLVLGAGDHS